MRDGDWGVLTYTLDDVVATLNGIQPYGWAGFLNERLNDTSTHAPLAGFTNNGYKLVYTDEPSAYMKAIQKNYHRVDDTHSRSEEQTSELQSQMRISYAVLLLKQKNERRKHQTQQ